MSDLHPATVESPPTAAAEEAPARRRRRFRPWRWVKKIAKRVGLRIAALCVPRLYLMWMWFIYKTSKVEQIGCLPSTIREQYGGGVFALWHDEVIFVAYSFKRWRPDTLASHGTAGEVITRMLKLCDFRVFRGGSSRGRKRRSVTIIRSMIEHMKKTDGVLFGITTDGSYGPPYRVKKGVVSIAVACGKPLAVEKTWCKRYIQLKTWDRTIVPLPFNHIVHVYAGPIVPPRDAWDPEELEKLRVRVEAELCRVTAYARHRVEGHLPEDWLALFPDHCRDGIHEAIEDLELTHPFDEVVIDRPDELGEDAIPSFPGEGEAVAAEQAEDAAKQAADRASSET